MKTNPYSRINETLLNDILLYIVGETHCTNPGIPFEEDTTWETGSTLHFYCVEGYTLLGEASLKCENNVWSSVEVPVCVGEYERADMKV